MASLMRALCGSGTGGSLTLREMVQASSVNGAVKLVRSFTDVAPRDLIATVGTAGAEYWRVYN